MRPPIPTDKDDVVIDDVWAETWSAEPYLFQLDNDWGVAIFGTEDNLLLLGTCSEIYLDGTFKTAPHPYEQMFTIHGKYRDRVCSSFKGKINRAVQGSACSNKAGTPETNRPPLETKESHCGF